jgi:predicted amidohydrolase
MEIFMKVCTVQPYYSFNEKDTQFCFDEMIKLIDECDDSLDIIVLPEYCDIPAAQDSKESFHKSIEEKNGIIMQKAIDTAKRCNAIVFVNAAYRSENGWINTTHAIDRQGNIVGKYFKAHPAPSEVKTEAEGGNELAVAYSYDFFEPYVIEIEGIRFGFMTC